MDGGMKEEFDPMVRVRISDSLLLRSWLVTMFLVVRFPLGQRFGEQVGGRHHVVNVTVLL
jgi:hypothetical protein